MEDTCLPRARVMELLQVMSLPYVTLLVQELPVLKVVDVLKVVKEVILKVMKEVEEVFLLSFSSTTDQRTPP